MSETERREIFKTWLQKHTGIMFKIVKAYASNLPDQEDLFQEIAIQLWHSIIAFRQESSASTWIYRVALNTSIKWSGKEFKQRQSTSLDNLEHILTENHPPADVRLVWLYEEISQLDKVDRSVALLLLDNFSYREMAQITGLTESNVGVRINRIKKYLINKSKQNDNNGI